METGDVRVDWRWAEAKYRREVQCMECGLITVAIPKPTIWQQMRSEWRRTVDRQAQPVVEEAER